MLHVLEINFSAPETVDKEGKTNLKQKFQAGAIAFRILNQELRILVVSAKRTPDTWIFPKGHVECDESVDAAAIRELREEAGIDAVPAGHIGYSILLLNGTRILVEYILAEYQSDVGSNENREIRWCSFDETLEILSYEYTKGMLRKARPIIENRLLSCPSKI